MFYVERIKEYLMNKIIKGTEMGKKSGEEKLGTTRREFAALLKLKRYPEWEVYEEWLIEGYIETFARLRVADRDTTLYLNGYLELYEKIFRALETMGEKQKRLEDKYGEEHRGDAEEVD